QFIPHHCVERLYPVTDPHSPEGEKLGRIPYSEAWFCALGTTLVRHTHALFRAPFKLIALDCDNTLWHGICGEDGPENVVLDPGRRALHEFMLDQREDGVLLAMNSKNNEEDVKETFRVHPEFPLQLRHFVTWRLNWEPKASNLQSMASQLGLGTDSFLFLDDNPKECAELASALPEVLTLPLPEAAEDIEHFLHHIWAFDHPVVTEEDRKRSAYYAQAAEFGNEVQRARSMADFIASIDLRVNVQPLNLAQLPRVSQLTQRTNQFNTTTIRRSESEIRGMLDSFTVLTAEVTDRFGDYGLVGVMILQAESDGILVDTLLLSCRVLGRGVEHRMLAEAAGLAIAAGVEQVHVPFFHTGKNKPALDFVNSLPAAARVSQADGFVLTLDADQIAQLEWKPSVPAQQSAEAPATRSVSTAARTVDYLRIATQLSTVPDIQRAMRADPEGAFGRGLTNTEYRLAVIWSDLLQRPNVLREDNFFDLGGHSLVAVLLLMRIQETFGVELAIDDVYTGGLTLSGLAARVESALAGELDPTGYAELLAEIESMTDEEARELLAREDGPPR
ncbi:MAG: HAD-IIIC family phosphatase, partial [Bryobacteraceae bacterium]|nr:HAD-IIIC family phosphatase [Bryobacteraceae bacterium]